MRLIHLLFLIFLLVPLVEIYVLIQVGSVLGALPTVLLVVLTAVLGVALLRFQGLLTLARFRSELLRGHLPAGSLVEGILLLLAGALLLTPGFVTDSFGFALLVPAVRTRLARWALRQVLPSRLRPGPPGGGSGSGPRTLEGDYWREDR